MKNFVKFFVFINFLKKKKITWFILISTNNFACKTEDNRV